MNPGEPPRVPLHVETHGGEGPPVLLLHGLGLSGHLWRHWLAELCQGFRVHVVDLKGFGRAPKPRDRRYSPLDQAALVHQLILQEDLRDIVLVGHSLGGAIALLTAILLGEEDPSRLRSLVLLSSVAFPQPISRYIRGAGLPFLGRMLLRMAPASLIVREALRLSYYDPRLVSEEVVHAYAQPLRRPRGRYALSWSARQLLPPDASAWTQRYSEVRVPTFLLWGSHDRVVPLWVGERLNRTLPAARLEVLANCGHMPPEERPQESLEKVLEFLETAGGGR